MSKHDASTMRHMKEPEDLFQQLFYAYQFFLNSSGVAGNRVDVAYLQYLLSSRGDEMSGDLFEEFLKAVDHPVKGSFDLALFMQVYLKYAMKAGIYSDDDAEKAAYDRINARNVLVESKEESQEDQHCGW